MMVNPPMCSLPSTYGPSVVSTSPSLSRTTVAVLGGCSPPVKTQAPAALSSCVPGGEVPHDRLEDLGRGRFAVGLVDAEQVLLHLRFLLGYRTLPGLLGLSGYLGYCAYLGYRALPAGW